MDEQPALVGIVPRKNLWTVIQKQRWYHVPLKSAPRNVLNVKYLAFYFPAVFGEKYRYQVIYYAPVLRIDTVKRIRLFPDELKHPRINEDYHRFHLDEIKELPRPIPSRRWRRIVHIPTSLERLFRAEEINDLYNTSPLEERMYREMKKRKIEAERQLYVCAGGLNYCLDFGVFCRKGSIDIECDGERYHNLPDALTRDRLRNNQLTSFGWHVLRFSGKEIRMGLTDCLDVVGRTVRALHGLKE